MHSISIWYAAYKIEKCEKLKTDISGIGVAGIILGIFEIFYTIAIHNKKASE